VPLGHKLSAKWRTPSGRAAGQALDDEEGDLVLEIAGHVVRATAVAEGEGETLGRVLSMRPTWRTMPWRTGSSASKQLPAQAAWLPTHSPEQWSTAPDRPKIRDALREQQSLDAVDVVPKLKFMRGIRPAWHKTCMALTVLFQRRTTTGT
jgi:hypothetical protein